MSLTYHSGPDQRSAIERRIDEMGQEAFLAQFKDSVEMAALYAQWQYWARPKQLMPPGDWFIDAQLAGRGFGKSFSLNNKLIDRILLGLEGDSALVGPTHDELINKLIRNPGSGLLTLADRRGIGYDWQESKKLLTWANGQVTICLSMDRPDRMRAVNLHTLGMDEIFTARYQQEVFDFIMPGVRMSQDPRVFIASTPKPTKLLKSLLKDPRCHFTTGSTFENEKNLAKTTLDYLRQRYENSRIGLQELYGQVLDSVDGSYVDFDLLESLITKELPEMVRTVVAVDPAATSKKDSDETGICVMGLGADGNGYILDCFGVRLPPDGWARAAIEQYNKHECSSVVIEVNQGGEMCNATLKSVDRTVRVESVRASKGKHVRFEPISTLLEQRRILFADASYPELFEQLSSFTSRGYEGAESPDRADAMVWAATHLMLDRPAEPRIWAI